MGDRGLGCDPFHAREPPHRCGAARHHRYKPKWMRARDSEATCHSKAFTQHTVGTKARTKIVRTTKFARLPLRNEIIISRQPKRSLLVICANAFNQSDSRTQ